VAELRATRRRRRLGDTQWGDLAYRVYTTALFCLVVAMMLAGWVGDQELTAQAAAQVADEAPGWLGLLVAVVLVAGVRSGGRGGPLALEAPDVHHLLLAPVSRGATLRRPSIEVLGYGALGGALAFGLAGSLAAQRLPGSNTEWVAVGALFGATLLTMGLGAALVTSSRRVPGVIAWAVSWGLLAWATASLVSTYLRDPPVRVPNAPTTQVARLALWPLRSGTVGLGGVLVALSLAAAGTLAIGGLSIEAARRRTQLVGQLRFAVTVQDLRSVVLLRRQLASELPRNRRWFPVPRLLSSRQPVLGRDLQSIAHWPAIRVVRVVVLCAVAALAARGMWSGTTPLVVVAGVATFVAALDATEPLAEEIDHPTLTAGLPVPLGQIHLRHLVAPCLVMVLAGAVGVGVAWAVDPTADVLTLGVVGVLIAGPAAVAGAAISVLSGSTPETSGALLTPEVAGPRLVLRTAWPPLVAMLGFAPLLVAGRTTSATPELVVLNVGVAVWILVALVFGWVRFRADIHRSMAESMGGGAGA
jgi:hypothetical protein